MDTELIWWCVMAGCALLGIMISQLPINEYYDPKGDDPYRYCPKEEEER